MHLTTRTPAAAAVTGAAYAALTMLLAPISYGAIQCRVSEVLCILPFFIPCTAWGLFAGCAIANLLSAAGIFDVVFGSVATLLAALCTAWLGRGRGAQSWARCILAALMPVVFNFVLVGAVLTGIIQSSSASVGILQALSATGAVSYAAAIPIIMGQNIGTTVTAMLSSVGTNKNARRAAVVHLLFNVIGVAVLLSVFCIVRAVLAPALLDESATRAGIAVAHSVFNLLCTAMLLPAGDLLEKLAIRLVPDSKSAETVSELDERLLAAPSLALSRSRAVACEMAQCAVRALNNALRSFTEYTDTLARSIRDDEERCDHYEDILGTYLVQLSARKMGVDESEEATELLKSIGDFERISDHAVNILESAEELRGKSLAFSAAAAREYDVLAAAIGEILDLSLRSFERQDVALAELVEPLEQVIDTLKEQMRTRHILRMQQGHCSIEAGFVWSDLLTNLERTSDHCSNIAGCVIDAAQHNLNLHETLRAAHSDTHAFRSEFQRYAAKYALPAPASAQ